MSRISNKALTAFATTVAAFGTTSAIASQGPGMMPGTASAFTQTAMAIVVYGAAALIIAAGLIGGLRRR